MDAPLHQINLGYDAEQDRLLLRISTTQRTEHRLWLTRRMVKAWWPGLLQLAARSAPMHSPPPPQVQQAVLEFRHQHAVQQADFATEYQPAAPLTAEPLLVHEIQMRELGPDLRELRLNPRQAPGVALKLKDEVLHGLLKLLQDAVRISGWDLQIELPVAVPPEARRLN